MDKTEYEMLDDIDKAFVAAFKHVQYPQPRQEPLTEEVINKLWGGFTDDMNRQQAMSFARAIEKAHGIGEKE